MLGKYLIILCFLILNGLFSKLSAQTFDAGLLKNYALMHDLADDWQVFDDKYEAYVPYIAERHKNPKSMSFWVDLEKYQPFQLVFYANPNTYLFIDNNLSRKINQATWINMNLDSLQKVQKKKKVFFTFYDAQLQLPLKSVIIAQKIKFTSTSKKLDKKIQSLDRQTRQGGFKNFVIIIGIFLLITYTFLWNYYPKIFYSFYNPQLSLSVLAFSRRDLAGVSRPFAGVNLFFMAAYALVLGFYYILSQIPQDKNLTFQWINLNPISISLIINYLLFSLIMFGVIFLKYIGISFSGLLLNISTSVSNTHFFEYIRLAMLFYLLLILFPIYFYVSQFYQIVWFFQIATYIIVGFHLIQSILVSFFVIQQTDYRSLYLFYYLCITELIPLLIGIKLLI